MKKFHPEQGDGEIYMGNTDIHGFEKSSWYSKRLGAIPYNAKGEKLNTAWHYNYYPWFIEISEIEFAIKNLELDIKTRGNVINQQETINIYRDMIEKRTICN